MKCFSFRTCSNFN